MIFFRVLKKFHRSVCRWVMRLMQFVGIHTQAKNARQHGKLVVVCFFLRRLYVILLISSRQAQTQTFNFIKVPNPIFFRFPISGFFISVPFDIKRVDFIDIKLQFLYVLFIQTNRMYFLRIGRIQSSSS